MPLNTVVACLVVGVVNVYGVGVQIIRHHGAGVPG